MPAVIYCIVLYAQDLQTWHFQELDPSEGDGQGHTV